YLDDAGPRYAAKVNGFEISANEFERSVSIQRQTLIRQNNGQLPIDENALRERTLDQLINQRLLEDVTYESGYRISDLVLSARIKQLFTVDGVFDRQRFERNVASIGMNVPMYEQALRNELRLQQMQSAITNSAFVTKEEVKNLAALAEQTRDINVLTFSSQVFSTVAKPTAEEIKQYYDANLQNFMEPEKAKVDYVEITSDALADNVVIDEVQIKKMYDDYVTSISGREQRKARHILIKTGEDKVAAQLKIESIKKELEQGANFSVLAEKYSEDTASGKNGGDLGWVSLGDMVKPFEQSLFELKKGEVSEVVETPFGYHLIELDDVKSETPESLAIKRYEFEEEIKNDSVASAFYDLSERLASTAYENPDSLDVVVEDLALKLNTTDYFTRNKGEGIAENEKVRNAAFSSLVFEQGNNSNVIEVGATHVVVLRMNEHVPATPIPLDVVSSKIENILESINGRKQTRAVALEVKSKIEAGASVDDLSADGITIETLTSIARADKAKVSDPAILYNAFEMIPGENNKPSIKVVDLISGDVALVVLNKVNLADDVPQDKLELIKNGALQVQALTDFSTALQVIKENASIDKNMSVVNKAE
ncbi:MAG: peptidylprolyl isomerase, partial [Gammaproteobacteria bacterium]|nr:peptidylprolyl isomerase [Gammaproteobacteria bacterium]